MEKEFEEYWKKHQKRLILKAPRKLREEYMESTRLDSPLDWVCFVVPVALGILMQSFLKLRSEILSWGISVFVVVLVFVLLQMVKPVLQHRKSTTQILLQIKKYYHDRFLEKGLDGMEPWD